MEATTPPRADDAGSARAVAPPTATGTPSPQTTTPTTTTTTAAETATLVTMRELIERRGYTKEAATELMTTSRCEECGDQLGVERTDDCECACHCTCCCAGFFRCINGCDCECACHYDPNAPEPLKPTEHDLVPETPQSDDGANNNDENVDMETQNREPAGCLDRAATADSEEGDGKQEEDVSMTDESSPTEAATDRRNIGQLSYTQLYEMLQRHHKPTDGATQPSYSVDEICGEYFSRVYSNLTSTGEKPKANTDFPATTSAERAKISAYFNVLLHKDYTQERLHGAFKTVVLAILRSSWTFDRVMNDRITNATAPTVAPTNAWGTTTSSPSQQLALTADTEQFRFDTTVFSADRISALRTICRAAQPFAATCRKPTDDEWTIILGIMNGTILVRSIPQFFKRVCNLAQMNWIHQQMILQAEGELYCKIPPQAMMYDYNQSSKRIADKLRKDAISQNWNKPELEEMIQATKTMTYNADLKAIHFHFFTKKEAVRWEGMDVPFGTRNTTKLINPDARYRELKTTADGTTAVIFKAPADGLEDDRYQGQYRFRVTNVTRTMEIDKLSLYLQQKTKNGIKLNTPIDSYGPTSEWSLLWDFYAHKSTCPPELVNINRIMWRDHALLILHKPGSNNQPCHQCARLGHVATACTVPQEDWLNDHTLQVTDDEIRGLKTERSMWRTPEEAKATFTALGTTPAPTTDTPSPTGQAPAPDTPAPDTPAPSTPAPHPPGSNIAAPGEDRRDPSTPLTNTSTNTASKTSSTTPTAGPSASERPPTDQNPSTIPTKPSSTGTPADQTDRSTPTGDDPSPSSATSTTKTTTPGNPWLTTVAKHTQHRVQQQQKNQPTNKTKQEKTRAIGNRYKSLEAPDAEDDDSDVIEVPAPGSKAAPRKPSSRRQRAFARAEDADSVSTAVHRADLTRLGLAIVAYARQEGRSIDHTAVLQHLEEALTHATASASKAWVFNAITGKCSSTPDTGNCQFYAIVEALLQHAFKDGISVDRMIELVTLLKYGIYHATTVDEAQEKHQAHPAAIVDYNNESKTDRTEDELQAEMAAYYTDLATSSSELKHILPERLYGGYDTLRMAAKLLQRKIYIVTETSDPTSVTLTSIVPRRLRDVTTRTQFVSATVEQPGMTEWFNYVKDDLKNHLTPIILHFNGNHYNSIMLQPTTPLRPRANSTKATKMTDHWKDHDGTIVRAADAAIPDGPTRLELVSSQSSVSPTDVIKALTQSNWNRHEKKLAIDLLIRDQPRMQELLAITVDDFSSGDATMEGEDDVTASLQLAQDLGEDPSNSTPPSGSVYTETGSSATASQPYVLPTPAEGAYATWSQQEWERVVQEWAEQDGTLLPPLTDRPAIAKFAATKPEIMTVLAKWYANPFILLDHFTDDDIKGWMAAKRMRYCLRHLETLINSIPASPEQTVLMEWLVAISHVPTLKLRVQAYRDSAKWAILREIAPEALKGPTSIPFLNMNYAKEFAFVLILDDLFPSLARDILVHEGRYHGGEVELPLVYRDSDAFRHALATGMAATDPSWQPVADYIESLRLPMDAPASRC